MSTIDGFTQSGSSSHCGPWMPIDARPRLMAPWLPLSSSRNIDAVATVGVIFGR
jgi:hypothetical protein